MTSRLNPYLNFKGNARQAMEFYHSVFGGKLQISTFGDYHSPVGPDEVNNIMHSELDADNGIVFFGSDTPTHMQPGFQVGTNLSMSLTGASTDEAELRGYFDKLSAGARVDMPLAKAPWGDTFGMLTDKFGIAWLVNITAPKP